MSILILFGSDARGSQDKYSDKDYLVVGSLEKLTVKIEADANINYYTKSQLEYMAKAGSLFLQHVKKEGLIIQDDSGWMNSFLEDLKFIAPLKSELEKCIYCINTILMVPDLIELQGWKADCLYVYLRDFIIKYLAKCGELIFSTKGLSEKFFIEHFKDEELFSLFADLRINKFLYRTRAVNPYLHINYDRLESFFSKNFFCESSHHIVRQVKFSDTLNMIDFKDKFHKLRFLEACMIIDEKVIKAFPNLEQIISSPNHYHGSFSKIPFDFIFESFLSQSKQ